jgi:hypothetical protein
MQQLTEEALEKAADEGLRASGYSDQLWIHNDVDGNGATVVYRAPSKAELRALWNGLNKGATAAVNARRVAFSSCVVIPDRVELNAIVARVPDLPKAALDPMLRLAGAGDWQGEPESAVVNDAVAAELVEQYGYDLDKLIEIRARYHHPGQLRAVYIGDDSLDRPKQAYLVKTPSEHGSNAFDRRRENPDDIFDAICDYVIDSMAYPVDDKAIQALFASAPALPTTLKHVCQKMARPAREAAGKGWRRSSARSPR